MDFETGEVQIPVNKETGEVDIAQVCIAHSRQHLNCETGEPELTELQRNQQEIHRLHQQSMHPRRSFRIPKEYIKKINDKDKNKLYHGTEDFQNTRMSSVILFLLPTVFFAPIMAIFVGVIEISLHIWAHKKNKSLRGRDIFYQSPLHVIVSEFCANCRDERSKNKITKMQDATNNKLTKYGGCFRIVT